MIAIVCMKWGTAFQPEYVNVLYRAVQRNLSYPFRFYCITDDAEGLDVGIVAKAIPDMGLPEMRVRRGCWPKISLFTPGLFEEETALFLDLDTVIVDSLDPLIDRQRSMGGLHIIREWNPVIWNLVPVSMRPDRGGQSSVFAWSPAAESGIHKALVEDQEDAFAHSRNDQEHIMRFASRPHYWPERWTASFKKSCVPHYPLNLVMKTRPAPNVKIVVFYGKPRPHHLIGLDNERWGTKYRYGYGAVDWVKAYWEEGRGAAPTN